MISDSFHNVPIAMAASNSRDFARKKRANRLAKLKQCKLDARREQWLSQVKNKEEVSGREVVVREPIGHLESERGRKIKKLDINRDEEAINGDGLSLHRFSDMESLPSDSSVNFSPSCSSSGGSSSSNDFCSENMSEEDEGDVRDDDDECLDDWEAVADALAATDNKEQDTEFCSPLKKHENENATESVTQVNKDNTNPESGVTDKLRTPLNFCAWRPDDAYRPQSLPSLSKQYSFPLNSDRHLSRVSTPKSCPICFEDLDDTDSCFLPCPCGFSLCLFCHKRVLEEDARCPGCRKHYDREPTLVTFRLNRSCSMITSRT